MKVKALLASLLLIASVSFVVAQSTGNKAGQKATCCKVDNNKNNVCDKKENGTCDKSKKQCGKQMAKKGCCANKK